MMKHYNIPDQELNNPFLELHCICDEEKCEGECVNPFYINECFDEELYENGENNG